MFVATLITALSACIALIFWASDRAARKQLNQAADLLMELGTKSVALARAADRQNEELQLLKLAHAALKERRETELRRAERKFEMLERAARKMEAKLRASREV